MSFALSVLALSTHVNPENPSKLVYDGGSFSILKGGKNISGDLTGAEAVDFIKEQAQDAIMIAETSGIFPGSVISC